jgi:tetratricopeptide (TPR) repeat protein/CHAT domain-containing protein
MKRHSLFCCIKCLLVFISMFFIFSPTYSQETENEITEAISHAIRGNYEQAIPILEKYSDFQGLDDYKSLEINVYLNFCYLEIKNEALNVDRLNKLTDSYLANHDVSKNEDATLIIFFVSAINGRVGNNEKMVSYLLIIKDNYKEKNLNRGDWLYSEVLRLLTRGYYYTEDYKSAIETGLIALKLNAEFGKENTSTSLEIHDLLFRSYDTTNESEKALVHLQKSVKIGKEILGETHPNYLNSLDNLALSYSDIGDYEQALAINQQVVEIRKAILGETHPDYLTSLSNLAATYSDLGDYNQALAINQQIVELRKSILGEKHPDYLNSLNNLASSYSDLGDYKSALAINQQVVELRKTVLGKTHPDYLTSLNNLAVAYSKLGDYNSALVINQQVVELRKTILGEIHPDYLTSLSNLASAYSDLGDHQTALAINQQVVESRKAILGETHPDYLTSLSNLAMSFSDLGDYQSAFAINQQVVESQKKILGERHPDYLTCLSNLANTYSKLGDYNSALVINQQVVELRKTILGEIHPDYLMSLSNLAATHSYLGDYKQALAINQQVVELRKTILGETHPDYLMSLSNLAATHSYLGDYKQALIINQQVVESAKELFGEKHPNYLMSLNNLASTYSKLGDYKQALAINQQVVELAKEVLGEKHPNYLTSLNNLAFSYSELRDFISALKINQHVVEVREEVLGEAHPDYLMSLNNLASNYSDLGDYKSSIAINKQVAVLQKDFLGERHPDFLGSLDNLAFSYSGLGDYQSAFEIYQQIVGVRKQVLGEKHPDYIISLSNIAVSEFNLKKIDTALNHFVQSLNLRQKRAIDYFGQLTEYQREQFWNQNRNDFTFFPLFLEKASNSNPEQIKFAYDIALFTKGLLLNTTLDFDQLLAEKGTPEAIEKYQDLKLLKLQIQRLYEKPIAERYLNVDSLETVAQKMETELVKLSKEYGDYTQNLKITWKDVQSNLGNNEVSIEFLEYPTLTDTVKYAALLLRKDWTNPKFIPLFRKDQIEEFLKRDPNQIYSNGFVGKEVKKLVWDPLEEFIAPGDKVHFSAAGILHQLAIENLSSNDSTTLGDRYQMYRLSSTKELALQKPESKTQSVALYGGIKYDLELNQMISESEKYKQKDSFYALRGIAQDSTLRKGWQFLPGTLTEANEISEILKENQYLVGEFLGETGSEESFKALSSKGTGIIHIATHGFFLPVEQSKRNLFIQMRFDGQSENIGYVDPMLRSGLLLAGGNRAWQGESIPDTIEDGILTAKEISHVDLRETDLVVLSACETGLGDVSSEGVFGLQRAFKQAGAQTIIMSLWNVKDEATQYLMTNFYSYLMKGASKREAFTQARNKCREQYQDPASWAAFIMLD